MESRYDKAMEQRNRLVMLEIERPLKVEEKIKLSDLRKEIEIIEAGRQITTYMLLYAAKHKKDNCSCIPAYKDRGRQDPQCHACVVSEEIEELEEDIYERFGLS